MIGNKIKAIRKNKGITQKELSRKADISISYIQQLEYNVKENPSLDILTAIANALEVKLSDITEASDLTGSTSTSSNIDDKSNQGYIFSEKEIKSQLSQVILNISVTTENKIIDKDLLKSFSDESYKFIEFLLSKYFDKL